MLLIILGPISKCRIFENFYVLKHFVTKVKPEIGGARWQISVPYRFRGSSEGHSYVECFPESDGGQHMPL